MKYLLIAALIITNAAQAQIRISGGTGLVSTETGLRLNGIINAGYEYKSVSIMADIRSAVYQNAGFFGLNAGYNIRLLSTQNIDCEENQVFFRPYVGMWYRKTGKTAQDRYVSGGQNHVLSVNDDVAGHNFGWGGQVQLNHIVLDVSYVSQWNFNIMWTYKFGE